MSRNKSWSLIFAGLALALLGCTGKNSPDSSKELNLAIWSNYLSEDAQARFTKETGIKINVMNYASNEELLAKAQAGPGTIDVAVPSDYMVDVMIKLELLEALDKKRLPVIESLSSESMAQPFDSQNAFSLPYAWAVAGIAVNRSLFKEPLNSWKDFFEHPKLAGKIALLDDVREVTAAVLKMQGQSVNTVDEKALADAKKELMKIRERIKMFSSDTIDILRNKEVVAAHAYSPDALQVASKSKGEIEFVIPKEGGTRSIDNLVIFKAARNKEAAHQLINFLLSKENNVQFVKTIHGGPVVQGVRDQLPDDLKTSPVLFPEKDTLARLERIVDLGEKNSLYEDIWTAVKTH